MLSIIWFHYVVAFNRWLSYQYTSIAIIYKLPHRYYVEANIFAIALLINIYNIRNNTVLHAPHCNTQQSIIYEYEYIIYTVLWILENSLSIVSFWCVLWRTVNRCNNWWNIIFNDIDGVLTGMSKSMLVLITNRVNVMLVLLLVWLWLAGVNCNAMLSNFHR